MPIPDVNWIPLLPLVVLTATVMLVIIVDLIFLDQGRETTLWVSVVGLAATLGVSAALWGGQEETLGGSFVLDAYGLFFNFLFCVAAIVTLLLSVDYLEETATESADYFTLILFATVGMLLMASAGDLIVQFLGLEVMSVAVYVLAGLQRGRLESNEAALKYFLLGAFATGFLLFGIALVYGAVGSTRVADVAAHLALNDASRMMTLGIVLIAIGFAFKVAAVPFHAWTPDVYEGSPTCVTALMAVGVKAAAFAAFGRVFLFGFGEASEVWTGMLWGLAALTMTAGNLLAITQTNLKRMLAYSSIAHAGYLLMALVAGGREGAGSLLFYLLAYGAMNLGAFAIVIALARGGEDNDDIDSLGGVGFRHPILGLAMTAFLLSLAGVPPFVGFAGKFYLFGAAIAEGYVGLAIIGVLNSVVSAYYYMWVIVTMFMREGEVEAIPLGERPYLAMAVGVSFGATLLIGLFPGPFVELARAGAASLL